MVGSYRRPSARPEGALAVSVSTTSMRVDTCKAVSSSVS